MSRISIAYAATAGSLLLLLVLDMARYLTGVAEIYAMYAHGILVLCLIGLLVRSVSRRVFRTELQELNASVLTAVLFFGFDPYSYGRRGGHTGLQAEFPWQSAATVTLVVVLLSSLTLLQKRNPSAARLLLSVELAAFLLLNGVYAARDGVALRFFAGEYSSPMPLLCTCAGLLVRFYAQVVFARVNSHPVQV